MRKLYFFKGFLVSLMLMVSESVSAWDFKVDDICYNKNSDGVSVSVTYNDKKESTYELIYNDTTKYEGVIAIPETVTYEGKTYSVTSIGEGLFVLALA